MKKYTLGIDCSTSKIGIALLDKKENIIISEAIKLDSKKPLEERASGNNTPADKIPQVILFNPLP